MRYDQVTSVLNEIMHDETIAAAAVYDDTGVAIARVVARPADQAVSEVSRPIRYSNGNIAVQAGRIAIAYSYATAVCRHRQPAGAAARGRPARQRLRP